MAFFDLNADYEDGDPYPAGHINRLRALVNTQVAGALLALGTGVLRRPVGTNTAENALKVTLAAGLVVNVLAGASIVEHPTYGPAYIRLGATTQRAIPANSTVNLFLVFSRTSSNDSQTMATCTLELSEDDSFEGGERLAQIVTGATTVTSIADKRRFSPGGRSGVLLQVRVVTNYPATGEEDRIDMYHAATSITTTLPTPAVAMLRQPRVSIGNVGLESGPTHNVVIEGGAAFTGGDTAVPLGGGDNLETYVVEAEPGVYRWHRA